MSYCFPQQSTPNFWLLPYHIISLIFFQKWTGNREKGTSVAWFINARYLLDLFWYCLEIAKYLDTSVLYWAWYWIWKIWVLILVLLLSLDLLGIDIDIGIPFQILRYWNWYWYWIQKHLVLVFSLKLSPGVLDVRLGGGNPQKRCPGENVSRSLNYVVAKKTVP